MTKKLEQKEEVKEFDFDNFEFKTLEDYKIYNDEAHKVYREAKMRNPKASPPIPVKVPPAEMHPTRYVKFQRFDQPSNVLKTRVRTKDIDWQGQLKPGQKYHLPIPVINFLNSLSTPIFEEIKHSNGESETVQTGEQSRFSCQLLEV